MHEVSFAEFSAAASRGGAKGRRWEPRAQLARTLEIDAGAACSDAGFQPKITTKSHAGGLRDIHHRVEQQLLPGSKLADLHGLPGAKNPMNSRW